MRTPARAAPTSVLADYLLLAGVVFAANLLPAFGPPTWAVLVFFRLHSDLAAVPLVILGACAAAGGRLVLATVSAHFSARLSQRRLESLEAAGAAVSGSRTRAVAGLGLFALSPVPSAQLFVAAGLTGVRLVPLTLAFFAGRLVSYSLYIGAASAAKASLGTILIGALTSPLGIIVQLAMLAGLVALVRVDWLELLSRSAGTRPPSPTHAS